MTAEMETELARLRDLNAKRTPGDWEARTYTDHDGPPFCDDLHICADLTDKPLNAAIASCEFDTDDMEYRDAPLRPEAEANQQFIAAAPAMMALLEQMAARMKELETDAERYRKTAARLKGQAVRLKDYRMAVAKRLVPYYIGDPGFIAKLCDEAIDRSGNLLGWLRDAARKEPTHE